ncbi:MAG: glycosyltransferase family 9 protein [Gemmatimonadota bacterium]|nr:glycosyltransferase family 9 protein [Gemmatimonadota bacterium]
MADSRAKVNDSAFRTRRKRWLAHTSEFVAPLLRTGATLAVRGATSEPSAWRTGLILGHNHVGDVLYRTCSLPSLAEGLRECRWSYLTSPSSAELLKGNPSVAEVLPWNVGDNSWQLGEGRFGELRRREFDVALCTNTLRHYPDLALSVALGIPNRVAFSYKGLSGLITRPAPIHFPSVYPAYFRRLVADLAGRTPAWPLQPRVYPTDEDAALARRVWTELGLGSPGLVVACSLTTRQASGNWPRAHLLAALENARSQADFDVVLCGAASDSTTLSAAARELSFPVRVLAGKLGLRAYVAFLSRCTALLTLDSGPRHLGNAARIPVLFARNLSHSRVEAGAYCEKEVDLAPAVEYLSDAQTRQVVAGLPVSATAGRLLQTLADATPMARA